MPTRPYYVIADVPQSERESLHPLLAPLVEVLKDILRPWPMHIDSIDLGNLLRIYNQVLLSKEYGDAEGEQSRTIIRWKRLIGLCHKLILEAFAKDEALVSRSVFRTMMEASNHEKEEYYQLQHAARSALDRKLVEDMIRSGIVLYHEIYEGRYRTFLACTQFLIGVIRGERLKTDQLDVLLKSDVAKLIGRLKKTHFFDKDGLGDLTFGVNLLARNAYSHGGIEFHAGKAFLKDGRDSMELDENTVQDLVRRISTTANGMAGGYLLSFIKLKRRMQGYVDWKYRVDQIQSVLYDAAKEQHFILNKCELSENETIEIELIEMRAGARVPPPSSLKSGSTTVNVTIVEAPPRRERVRELITSYSSIFNGYATIAISMKDNQGIPKGVVKQPLDQLSASTFEQISND